MHRVCYNDHKDRSERTDMTDIAERHADLLISPDRLRDELLPVETNICVTGAGSATIDQSDLLDNVLWRRRGKAS